MSTIGIKVVLPEPAEDSGGVLDIVENEPIAQVAYAVPLPSKRFAYVTSYSRFGIVRQPAFCLTCIGSIMPHSHRQQPHLDPRSC